MSQPLVYSKFRLIEPDGAALDAAPMEPFPLRPSSSFRIVTMINEPAMQVVYEDWFKGNDIEWVYWVDAFHIVISGEAEISYRDPPAWSETKTVVARAGAMYLTPRGAHVKWRVLSDEPFRHVVLDIPNAGFSFDAANATPGR
jgi:hypothetical protein